ncbi:hypothetical protein CHCC15087_3781 [Bacillus licheniformis]|nr:hypothetical protein CHCC15087_3781 [Bacillus licheniformis]
MKIFKDLHKKTKLKRACANMLSGSQAPTVQSHELESS